MIDLKCEKILEVISKRSGLRMNKDELWIDEPKFVMKAAHAVWAANKYYILACRQQAYLKIRQLLRTENIQLQAAYDVLENVINQFKDVKRKDLPQLENALYHIAGYFKKNLTKKQRQQLTLLIQKDPEEALDRLEYYSCMFNVDYLKNTTLLQENNEKLFNEVPIELTYKNVTYPKGELFWKGHYVLLKK